MVQAIAVFNVGWDKLASSAGPPCRKHREILVGRRSETPLVPPYMFRRPNKAMALKKWYGRSEVRRGTVIPHAAQSERFPSGVASAQWHSLWKVVGTFHVP